MRILKSLFAMIALLCLLCSCANGNDDQKILLSQQDKSLEELSTKIYDNAELAAIASFEGSLEELDASYPIECIREIPAGYRISYCGDTDLASLLFDNSGQKIMGRVYQMSKSKSSFDNLSIGKSLDDVMELDPDGIYLFLYTGRNDSPRHSIHYTVDGYLIVIEYDEENFITNIESELI